MIYQIDKTYLSPKEGAAVAENAADAGAEVAGAAGVEAAGRENPEPAAPEILKFKPPAAGAAPDASEDAGVAGREKPGAAAATGVDAMTGTVESLTGLEDPIT
jgi:hypothetical protein